jgi:uncharacterized metal-binding protein YceD (DUF177 family)
MIEFSRPFSVETLKAGEIEQSITASHNECTALAARFAIAGVESVKATLRVRSSPLMPGRYEVEGQASATLVLTCSVSADEFPYSVDETIRAVFLSGPIPTHTEDMEIDYEWDDPEPLEHGIIDLGELVAQHIFLAIPAYPRKPDAGWEGPTDEDAEILPAKKSPFAVLQGLKEHKT